LGADDFRLREFFAIEAAFRSTLLLSSQLGEFQRASGCRTYRQPATLRAHVFFAVLYWAAPATHGSASIGFLGWPRAAHPATGKRLSLWSSNIAEIASNTRNLTSRSISASP
jgi:hypothetical protein